MCSPSLQLKPFLSQDLFSRRSSTMACNEMGFADCMGHVYALFDAETLHRVNSNEGVMHSCGETGRYITLPMERPSVWAGMNRTGENMERGCHAAMCSPELQGWRHVTSPVGIRDQSPMDDCEMQHNNVLSSTSTIEVRGDEHGTFSSGLLAARQRLVQQIEYATHLEALTKRDRGEAKSSAHSMCKPRRAQRAASSAIVSRTTSDDSYMDDGLTLGPGLPPNKSRRASINVSRGTGREGQVLMQVEVPVEGGGSLSAEI